jgi:deoxyribose-phosphate aldolase
MSIEDLQEIIQLAGEYEAELPPPSEALSPPQGAEIAGWIDHTLIKPEATPAEIKRLCDEARQYNFASVFVNPAYVPLARGLLSNTEIAICTSVGFPLGATLPTYKVMETLACLEAGASEIDMVINIGALKAEAYGQVFNEVLSVGQVAHNAGAQVKVIIETAYLTRFEKIIASLISKEAGADFVKTSTGFASSGATVEDVDLIRRVVGPGIGVKASGGIHSYKDALAMIHSGANRLGTSRGVKIVQDAEV